MHAWHPYRHTGGTRVVDPLLATPMLIASANAMAAMVSCYRIVRLTCALLTCLGVSPCSTRPLPLKLLSMGA